MFRQCAGRVAAAAGVLVVSLGLAEVGVRTLSLAPGFGDVEFGQYRTCSDPELLWELIPGSTGVNSLGLRGDEITQPKSRLRLAVVGDSIAYGGGLKPAETIPARLQAALDAAGKRVEVVNGGVSGYNTIQEARWIETKAEQLQLDGILLVFCVNDIELLDGLPEGITRTATAGAAADALGLVHNASRHGTMVHWLLEHSHLSRLVFDRAARIQNRKYRETRELTPVQVGFDRIRAFTTAHSIPVTVAIVPVFRGYEENYPYEWLHNAVAGLAKDHGFTAIDILPAARKDAHTLHRALCLPKDELHPNPEGANLIAVTVAKHWFP